MKIIKKGTLRKTLPWKIGAYDVETQGLDATAFLFGVCIWRDTPTTIKEKIFYDRDEMVHFMTRRSFRGYRWYAHNAGGYDLISLFDNYLEVENFKVVLNKGRFIQGTYKLPGKNGNIYFYDSLNLFPNSLEKLGREMKIPKLKTPEKLIQGNSKDIDQTDIDYCLNDAYIVLCAVENFQNFIYDNFGVSVGSTIAQTAQRIFLTNFIDHDLRISDYDSFFRYSYYGGRVELLAKKRIPTYAYYYDFNSLYPSVMSEIQYPDPENLEYHRGHRLSILEFEGVSYVDVYVPKMFYPPLPYKANRLIFPIGNFSGWYNHNELRLALKYGCEIRIHKTIYSRNTINPFKQYVKILYDYRKKAKSQGHSAESLYLKLLLNSLYGKFGQQTEERKYGFCFEEHDDTWIFEPFKDTDLGIWKKVDDRGHIIRKDAKRSILTFASYTTSGARIKLYDAVQRYVLDKEYDILYTDTDSIITTNPSIPHGKELGELDLERATTFTFYAPKAYEYLDENGKRVVKLKGISNPEKITDTYKKVRILKVVEALRRGLKAGKPIEVEKHLSLDDVKRVWKTNEKSEPIDLDHIKDLQRIEKEIQEYMEMLNESMKMKSSQSAGLIVDDFGEVLGRVGSYNENIPEWYREAKKLGFKKKDILRDRAIYELEMYDPEFRKIYEKVRDLYDRTNIKKIKDICFGRH